MNGWRNTECWLVNAMKGLSRFGSLAPAYPSAQGYLRAHASPSIALREAHAAREIFVLCIGRALVSSPMQLQELIQHYINNGTPF